MFDLKKVGAWLIKNNLMNTPFNQFSTDQISQFCGCVVESVTGTAVTPPVLIGDELILPPTVPQKYKWWAGGQSIRETLTEMGAPAHVIEKYCPAQDREGLVKHE